MKKWITPGLLAALTLVALPGAPRAHDGGQPAPAAATGPRAPGSTTITANAVGGMGDICEVLLRYDPLPAGEPGTLEVRVSDALTGEPIAGAEVELTLIGHKGRLKARPKPTKTPGAYAATLSLPADGSYETIATVARGSELDLVRLGPIHAGVLADGVTPARHGNLQQWLLGMVVLVILTLLGLSIILRNQSSEDPPRG